VCLHRSTGDLSVIVEKEVVMEVVTGRRMLLWDGCCYGKKDVVMGRRMLLLDGLSCDGMKRHSGCNFI